MTIASLPLSEDYWKSFTISKIDIEFINNYLFENEVPLSAKDLVPLIISERIHQEKLLALKKQKDLGKVYLPGEKFQLGERLVFKQFDWKEGKVTEIRPGVNPNIGEFQVITVEFEGAEPRLFAGGLPDHKLTQLQMEDSTFGNSGIEGILNTYGFNIETKLISALANEGGLVRIAGKWFTKALLIDISQGHLNLAEAVLDEANGTPLSTTSILDKVEISGNINKNLLEFSMNFALQEDDRFDEIGPAGEVLWCLERLEPEGVRKIPEQLRYKPLEYDESVLTDQMRSLEVELDDELSDFEGLEPNLSESTTISLTFPHWRAGTFPVSNKVKPLIPFAYESERIRFTLVDQKTKDEIPAWVVRKNKYIYGLKDYFEKNGLIPGSMITIRKSSIPGKVLIEAKIRRPTKEWVRTVLVGRDGGIVFAMLKQNISTDYNERMVIAVPDVENLDIAREKFAKSKTSFEDGVSTIMRGLTRLNLQGHIHAQELYSAINVVMRCPPAPLLSLLNSADKFKHVGDLHFRIEEAV
jgi:hypothetical protein